MKPFLFVFSVLLSAQSAVDLPPMAQVLGSDGLLLPVYGLAGNFVNGRPEAGSPLLAYSNDGVIEWRLEHGRLTATRDGQTAVLATEATGAVFRGEMALLTGAAECLRLEDSRLTPTAGELSPQLAGRVITWRDGRLRVLQPGGTEEEIDCPSEPEQMTAAAANWAHVTIAGRAHLLRLTPGRVELFVLPKGGRP